MRRWFPFGLLPFSSSFASRGVPSGVACCGGAVFVSRVLALPLLPSSGLAPFGCFAALCFGRVFWGLSSALQFAVFVYLLGFGLTDYLWFCDVHVSVSSAVETFLFGVVQFLPCDFS